MEAITYAVADGITIARRNLTKIIRIPGILVGMLITPIMMVLLFHTSSAARSTSPEARTANTSWPARSR